MLKVEKQLKSPLVSWTESSQSSPLYTSEWDCPAVRKATKKTISPPASPECPDSIFFLQLNYLGINCKANRTAPLSTLNLTSVSVVRGVLASSCLSDDLMIKLLMETSDFIKVSGSVRPGRNVSFSSCSWSKTLFSSALKVCSLALVNLLFLGSGTSRTCEGGATDDHGQRDTLHSRSEVNKWTKVKWSGH